MRECKNCQHGPNPNGRLFPHAGQSGCRRMEKIDKAFPNLSSDLQDRAEALSTGIIIYLQTVWREEVVSDCPGWQE